jgi:hypothetical protein
MLVCWSGFDGEARPKELDIIVSSQCLTPQKMMRTALLYGEVMEAEQLVDIEGGGIRRSPLHLSALGTPLEMLNDRVRGDFGAKYLPTVDLRPPLDFEGPWPIEEQVAKFKRALLNRPTCEQIGWLGKEGP